MEILLSSPRRRVVGELRFGLDDAAVVVHFVLASGGLSCLEAVVMRVARAPPNCGEDLVVLGGRYIWQLVVVRCLRTPLSSIGPNSPASTPLVCGSILPMSLRLPARHV